MEDLRKQLDKLRKEIKDFNVRKRLGELKNPRELKKFIRYVRLKGKRDNLNQLWQRLMEKGPTKLNLLAVIKTGWKNLQKRAWEELSKLKDLTLDELYDVRGSVNNESLRKKVEQKIIEMATGADDLLDIIKNEEEALEKKAWEELRGRIQNGRVKKSYARRILIKIIKEVPDLRMETWGLLKTLNPTDGELQEILDLEFTYSLPDLVKEIGELLRKKPKKKEKNKRIVNKIKETVEDINRLKKGQK